MKFSLTLPRSFRTGTVVVAVLAATGWALRPLAEPIREELRSAEPAPRLGSLSDALGQGMNVLGGLRAMLADFIYLKACLDWEDTRLDQTIAGLRLATAVDPSSLYFWLNGASMMALDMSNWRVDAEGGAYKVPKARQRQIDREQAALGLAFLEEARRFHPRAPTIYEKMAFIHHIRLRPAAEDEAGANAELLRAAELYHLASTQPGAPFYDVRLQASLLKEAGHFREAYDALVKIYPTLPKAPDDPGYARRPIKNPPPSENEVMAAQAGDVFGRIRDLEKQLGIAPGQGFQP